MKTELSLVDKIELARAYQPLTGCWIIQWPILISRAFTDQMCFTIDNLLLYSEFLDSERQSSAWTYTKPSGELLILPCGRPPAFLWLM